MYIYRNGADEAVIYGQTKRDRESEFQLLSVLRQPKLKAKL